MEDEFFRWAKDYLTDGMCSAAEINMNWDMVDDLEQAWKNKQTKETKMTIDKEIRPHVAQAYQELDDAQDEWQAWYAIFCLAAKLKLRDDGRKLDDLTQVDIDTVVFDWLDGKDSDEFEDCVERAIELTP